MCRFFRTFVGIKQADILPLQQTLQFSDYSDLYINHRKRPIKRIAFLSVRSFGHFNILYH